MLNICRKFEFLISQGRRGNMPKVRWVMSDRFCSKFHTLSSGAKKFEDRLRFDKVTESLKVGTFLRHGVE